MSAVDPNYPLAVQTLLNMALVKLDCGGHDQAAAHVSMALAVIAAEAPKIPAHPFAGLPLALGRAR